jgi:hypothetical protein
MMMLIDRNRVDEDNFVYEATLGGVKGYINIAICI